jgi:hypothetical protein
MKFMKHLDGSPRCGADHQSENTDRRTQVSSSRREATRLSAKRRERSSSCSSDTITTTSHPHGFAHTRRGESHCVLAQQQRAEDEDKLLSEEEYQHTELQVRQIIEEEEYQQIYGDLSPPPYLFL